MSKENDKKNSIIREINSLSKVESSLRLTNKILNENDRRLVHEEFKSVTIGDQIWMAENLNVDRFRNGESIPHVQSAEEWKKAGEEGKPAWCYYDNDTENGTKYGKLYNWYAVNDPRGLAPEGWHVPSNIEWAVLIEYLGGEDFAGKKMKDQNGWSDKGNGTNESGFSGFPGGSRDSYGFFEEVGENGVWWSFTESAFNVWVRTMENRGDAAFRCGGRKSGGFSIRCMRD